MDLIYAMIASTMMILFALMLSLILLPLFIFLIKGIYKLFKWIWNKIWK